MNMMVLDSESAFTHCMVLSICSFVCNGLFVAKMRTQNAIFSKTKQIRALVSIDDP